jgi:beta-galactosidase
MRSAIIKSPDARQEAGVMVGGAKIIWSDSVTDGRMRDTEVTRTSGVLDGARLPKELFWAFQVAQGTTPAVYILGHWNYPAGTVKRVYVAGNTPQVRLQTFDTSGKLIKDYGLGKTDFFPSYFSRSGDQVNHYVFAFDGVAWQPGSIKAVGCDANGAQLAVNEKATAGAPAAIKLTPITGPSGKWFADGNDIAMFDVEVVDANGKRCPTYEDAIDFSCSGDGTFLGGYNSGIRDSTNLDHKTSGYHLNVECGINRVFVRATRNAGTFTLNAGSTAAGEPQLKPASASVTSVPIVVTNGLSTQWPQKYTVNLGPEPQGVK